MPLTSREFEQGAEYWTTATRWPADFHNVFYGQMAERNPNGAFDSAWWQPFARELRRWIATRGVSMQVLTRNAEAAFPELADTWERCCAPNTDRDISTVKWGEVSDWVQVVAAIKSVHSPVFRAKFSHFLLPQVFPVVDGGVMGFPFGYSYQSHFEGVQREWANTPPELRQELREALVSRIDAPLTATYPVINKIAEICLIGRRHQ